MYKIQGATHKGMLREHNEDRYTGCMLSEDYGYALVCDGMGGENGGSVASTTACEEIRRLMESSYRTDLTQSSIYMILEAALEAANTAIFLRAAQEPDLSGMGTTVSLAVVSGSHCYIANVGDSRAYLLHNETLTQLTVDHTHVQSLIDKGEITPEEAKTHPKRHYLTRAVGVSAQISPSFAETELATGDVLLLCSDGLYNMVDDATLIRLLHRVRDGEDPSILIDEANRLGGLDNITAMATINVGKGVERLDG
ncbi:MAG: Stp1/IreP family PP2C-type Ser/Thr phosphatase [Angelakisella sp.]